MNEALRIAATGMESQQLLSNVIANNMANVNTNAYKRSVVHFQDMMYQTLATPGAATSTSETPVGVQVGRGVRTVAVAKDFTQGSLQKTSAEMDLAIEGDGFFEVEQADGTSAYTRNGNFQVTSNGQVVTSEGLPVVGFPSLNTAATAVDIAADGTVSATVDGVSTEQGRIALVRFASPEGLEALGHGLYRSSDASGDARSGQPAEGGFGQVSQGYLESSNVEIVNEMVDLIAAQRAYELISKSIRSADEMLRIANNIR